jgi:glutaredoxin 3
VENGVKVRVYTTDPCGFCRQAKALLESHGVDYVEVSLTKDPDGRAGLVRRTGQMTFPQIIVGERVIGGFRELLEATRDGTLDELLSLNGGPPADTNPQVRVRSLLEGSGS